MKTTENNDDMARQMTYKKEQCHSIKTCNTKMTSYENKRNSVQYSPHWNGWKYI